LHMNRIVFPLTILMLMVSLHASAHKVNLFAWVEGDTIHTESYFPDGRVVQKGKILVYDRGENLLLSGTTDDEGLFSFPIPKREDLNIVLDASMGHRTSFIVTAEELGAVPAPEEEKAAVSPVTDKEKTQDKSVRETERDTVGQVPDDNGGLTLDEVRLVVREEISQQLEPLSAKLNRLKEEERVGVQEVIAGIGYIMGLMGLVMYFQSKRRK